MAKVRNIFFDIETVPLIEERLARKMHEESMDRAIKSGKPTQDFERFKQEAAINGAFARVITIGYAIDDGPVEVLEISPSDVFDPIDHDSEAAEYDLLERFADVIEEAKEEEVIASFDGRSRRVRPHVNLVGWNINIFDLRMLWQRSVLTGSRLVNMVPQPDTPPWKMDGVIDLAAIWNGNGWSNRATQYDLALAAGVITEDVVFGDEENGVIPSGSGGDIYQWVKDGQWGRVVHHQETDIRVTRALFYLLVKKVGWQQARAKFLNGSRDEGGNAARGDGLQPIF